MEIDLQVQGINLSSFEERVIKASRIQAHGLLLVLQEPELTVIQVSSNTNNVFGLTPEEVLHKSLEELLDPFQVEKIKAGLTADNLDYINPAKIWVRKKGDDYSIFDGIFHRNLDGFLILELEPAISQDNIPFLSFYHLARASINQLHETSSLREFCQIIVKEVRKVIGFDRVMLYKFDDDGHGSVLAEEKSESMVSYLGLHYPESDIPKAARKLLSSNWIRLIPDAKAESVEIYPAQNQDNERPIDLTYSILRSASPCHIEYLHNMGVGASLTISLTKDDKLWGLIACHHQTPKYISYELRKACEFLGRVIFAEISTKEETEDYDYRNSLTHIQSVLIEYMSQEENFINGLIKYQPNLLDLTSAQGAAVSFGDNCVVIGDTPKEEETNFLI